MECLHSFLWACSWLSTRNLKCMAVGWIVRCDRPPLLNVFAFLYITKNFITFYETFFNETIALFLKQLEVNFKYQRTSQCYKRIQKHEILLALCENIAPTISWSRLKAVVLMKHCLPIVWNKYLLIKKVDITNSFSAWQLIKLSFMGPKDRAAQK